MVVLRVASLDSTTVDRKVVWDYSKADSMAVQSAAELVVQWAILVEKMKVDQLAEMTGQK